MPKPFPHLLLAALILLPSMALAQDSASLKRFLQHYVGYPPTDFNKGMRYAEAWVDLNEDGKQEAIVYLLGWCGSGGCDTLVLKPEKTSYKIITKLAIVQLPVKVLSAKSLGWHNLSVRVHGGGIVKAYDVELRFNGKTYPSNPTVPPARPLRRKVESRVLLSDEDYSSAPPLYP